MLSCGSESGPGGNIGCSRAEKTFGNTEEKGCVGIFLDFAACGE